MEFIFDTLVRNEDGSLLSTSIRKDRMMVVEGKESPLKLEEIEPIYKTAAEKILPYLKKLSELDIRSPLWTNGYDKMSYAKIYSDENSSTQAWHFDHSPKSKLFFKEFLFFLDKKRSHGCPGAVTGLSR